ncbi:BAHD acyltransferase [Prunus yedoensis var. nudiflora]|uniref:BAHD acyltransferase n=1 Tax=Prunus yedoensis var. nudiflora TaxID=2094558 RepID=A0A314YWG3_PRUYE|nr:BAHD acyltransferase [Prunus yedoensis var. nudiflora]
MEVMVIVMKHKCGARWVQGLGLKSFTRKKFHLPSPTPQHLKTTNHSVFDQLIPELYVPILLFYPNNTNSDHDIDEICKLLKTSLSETLTHFYPFAGKYQCNDSIRCNDHGAAFLEAQVNCPMSKILEKPDFGMLKQLLPADMGSRLADPSYLVQVQANFFECGGMAIRVCISHKVADASTISKFITSWAAASLGSVSTTDQVVLPAADFGAAASLLPQLGFLNSPLPMVEFAKEKWTTRRIVFDASKIAALKCKAATAILPKPTRVEVLSALIWKCATESSRSKLGSIRPSVWLPFVNMRKVLVQPLAEIFEGNFFGVLAAKTKVSEDDDDEDVQRLAAKLRKDIEEFKVTYANGVSGDDPCEFFQEFGSLMDGNDGDAYSCSSWCRFPFYTVNFGWGKPSWVTQCMEVKNMIVLTDTRDGDGIEASLTLNEDVMAIFESNKELLAYASLNPSVI